MSSEIQNIVKSVISIKHWDLQGNKQNIERIKKLLASCGGCLEECDLFAIVIHKDDDDVMKHKECVNGC